VVEPPLFLRSVSVSKKTFMLELRPSCENCGVLLPPGTEDAFICSFECTFCRTCALDILGNVCPNCTGGFVPRPIRPKGKLEKYPPSEKKIYKPVSAEKQLEFRNRYGSVPPSER
jgi:hypothetical protein